MPPSTVSDRVAVLEKNLGRTLLIRTTRSLRLTDAGKEYFAKSAPAIEQLNALFRDTAEGHEVSVGTLRIACPADFASAEIAASVAEYRRSFPQVEVQLIFGNELVDLHHDEIDIAIRGGLLKDSSLRAKNVGSGSVIFVATPAYLAGTGKLRTLKDLNQHTGIHFANSKELQAKATWPVRNRSNKVVKVKPRDLIKTNSFRSAADLVLAHQGIGFIPRWFVKNEIAAGLLTQVLPEWSSGSVPVQIVFLDQRFQPRKIREMVTILSGRIGSLLA